MPKWLYHVRAEEHPTIDRGRSADRGGCRHAVSFHAVARAKLYPVNSRSMPTHAPDRTALLPGKLSEPAGRFDLAAIRREVSGSFTSREIAARLGVKPARGSQIAGLRRLSEQQRQTVWDGRMSVAHGYLLSSSKLNPTHRNFLFAQMAEEGFRWTRADLQTRIKEVIAGKSHEEIVATVDPDIADLANRLSTALQTPVQIFHGRNGGGEVRIRYHSSDELDGFIQRVLEPDSFG